MIHVVDRVMGAGKSSAAITYMNEHPDKKFLYVTPFLDETERIVKACAGLRFAEPSDRIPEYKFSKGNHLRALCNQRRNIAMTHALFLRIDDVTAQVITDGGYTIIIDEVIDVFEEVATSMEDVSMLAEAGYLQCFDKGSEYEYYRLSEKAADYSGVFNEFFNKTKSGQIVQTNGWEGDRRVKYGFWQVNRRLFTLSDEIFILTYMFDGMPMKGFLDANRLPYEYLSVRKCDDGKYRFSDSGRLPSYIEDLRGMIHVCDKDSINRIGDDQYALSAGWTRRAETDGRLAALRRHVTTYFRRHVPEEIGAEKTLWTTYKFGMNGVKGKGASEKHFLSFNSKATNAYGDRAALAFCVNIFMNPNLLHYLRHVGVELDQDKYALAVMVQWIWRSRIRNGQEIWIYIPSRRMRRLFLEWIEDLESAYRKEQEVTDGEQSGSYIL